MALTIYGTSQSRTRRVLWCAEELGLSYEHVPLKPGDPRLAEEPLRTLNPSGRIPFIVEDGFALSESLAICLYLAARHGEGGLQPDGLEGAALAWRWSLWAQGTLEPWLQRDARLRELLASIRPRVSGEIGAALDHLQEALDSREWLIGGRLTIADLNVASVLSPTRTEDLTELNSRPAVIAWLHRCRSRPAQARAAARP